MRLHTGKRLGQSDNELTSAVFFSLLIHAIFFFGIFYLSLQLKQRTFAPPFYRVNLVDLPSEIPMTPTAAAPQEAPPAPVPPTPPKVKAKAAPVKTKASVRPAPAPKAALSPKAAMPDLDASKKSQETTPQTQETTGKRQESVSVQAPTEFAPGSQFEWYSSNVRMKIKRNWKHEYSLKNTSATVEFTILRSGMVQKVELKKASGIFPYDQAAIRAIRLSSPFPPLPEEFLKSSVVFEVDLQPEE